MFGKSKNVLFGKDKGPKNIVLNVFENLEYWINIYQKYENWNLVLRDQYLEENAHWSFANFNCMNEKLNMGSMSLRKHDMEISYS